MASQMFVDVAPSIAVMVDCFIVGIIVVRNFNPSIVSMSTQMHIHRYIGPIDAKGGGDGSRTSSVDLCTLVHKKATSTCKSGLLLLHRNSKCAVSV